ncbi:NAD-dependent dehydratase [Candidatus Falkowbacteria bacterium CG10_big_fil_rev_8_21_14_0_10_37_14]|uniref:NAD-dependent dehydratase n=1 Tax=Candidatus Falkowbacteria bacterium CG10_big_fil_rev_8_21_14_0_10_37_14 TaxID=1974561 RepID=A0A2M6WU47_9BACT|nr:NAD-dependent epimerase/dehydratase family protein [Candidatus Falkowbacteria bacterium]PIT96317.1 MAG: NAD-dependent dehydratase [Candidatus Falkowbacteria bacterium CG10_big_fil_rev_8_21_14_0_10_37_14]
MSGKFIFEKKNVLVLGGAGFIGSHLCDRLIKDCKVICVDNLSSGTESNIDHLLANSNFKFIKHDMALPLNLEDYTELAEMRIEFQGIQEIYNLACPTSPKFFDRNKVANVLANSYVVKNALDQALKYQAKLLHGSSSVVYGERRNEWEHVKEDQVGLVNHLSQRASYDEGKRFAETMMVTYGSVFELDIKIARLFRIYGPRMAFNEGHMISDFVAAALDNEPLVIFGDESFKTSLCYIDDCISGLMKLMASDIKTPVNIGSDIDLRLVDVASRVIEITNSTSSIAHSEALLFMTSLVLPDISVARDSLSWLPLVTLDNGLKKTIEDLRAVKNLKIS